MLDCCATVTVLAAATANFVADADAAAVVHAGERIDEFGGSTMNTQGRAALPPM
jgi:hypothetical protein